jgi:hypothetical protein
MQPIKLLDSLLFKWIPMLNPKKNIMPLQSVNFLLLLAFIVLFFINYVEDKKFNIALICFFFVYSISMVYALSIDNKYLLYGLLLFIVPIIGLITAFNNILSKVMEFINVEAIIYVIVILAWVKWAFTHIASIFTNGPTPNTAIIVLNALYVLIRLIFSIAMIPLAIFLLILYILCNSFFGIMRFESNPFTVIQGIISYIRRNDKEFYEKHNLTYLQYFNDFLYGQSTFVAWILLCIFYIIQMPFRVSSSNLKHTLSLFFILMISLLALIIYSFKKESYCSSGGYSTSGKGTNPTPQTTTENIFNQIPKALPKETMETLFNNIPDSLKKTFNQEATTTTTTPT